MLPVCYCIFKNYGRRNFECFLESKGKRPIEKDREISYREYNERQEAIMVTLKSTSEQEQANQRKETFLPKHITKYIYTNTVIILLSEVFLIP